VLQYGSFPPHCESLVHEAVHWLVIESQTRPASPHWPLLTHWTQRFVDVLQ
jgi:hypothetical protein